LPASRWNCWSRRGFRGQPPRSTTSCHKPPPHLGLPDAQLAAHGERGQPPPRCLGPYCKRRSCSWHSVAKELGLASGQMK
jgi:hypothetical protein